MIITRFRILFGSIVMSLGFSRSLIFSALVTIFILSSSCAYKAGPGDRQIPGGYRMIAVPVFKNSTHETGAEIFFTNAMVREIERVRIGRVTDRQNAQVTLEGKIDSIQYIASAPTQAAEHPALNLPANTILNSEYRILARASMRLRRNSDKKILWEGSFDKEQVYLAPKIGSEGLSSANALYNHSARQQTLQTIASEMMSEAHDRLTENF